MACRASVEQRYSGSEYRVTNRPTVIAATLVARVITHAHVPLLPRDGKLFRTERSGKNDCANDDAGIVRKARHDNGDEPREEHPPLSCHPFAPDLQARKDVEASSGSLSSRASRALDFPPRLCAY